RGFHQHTKCQRLSLPTYPFERKPYWIPLQSSQELNSTQSNAAQSNSAQSNLTQKSPELADWFYLPTWKHLPLSAQSKDSTNLETQPQLVFADQTLKNRLLDKLESSQMQLTLKWVDFENLKALISLVKTLSELEKPTTLTFLTADAYAVTPHDSLDPNKAKAVGLSQVIAQEYPGLCCRVIDVSASASERSLQSVCREIASPYDLGQRQVAYRNGQRWVHTHEPFPLPEQTPTQLKRNGTYLIAGDLIEGLGMVYATALVKEWDAKLILLGRAGLPAAAEWEKWLLTHGPQHSVSRLIRQLQALGQEGVQFCWFSGSLADEAWVSASIHHGVEQLGEITGVFHAGVMGDRASCEISQLTDDDIDRICRNKVEGMRSLQEALIHHPVDFYVLQSSLSSVVGGIGFGIHAAANSYLDSLAIQQNHLQEDAAEKSHTEKSAASTSARWLSLNWDACQLDETAPSKSSELMSLAMSAEEVWQTTQRALSQPDLSQVIISPRPLAPRITKAFTPQPIRTDVTSHPSDSSQPSQSHIPNHSRPAIATEYVAPRTDVEQTVAQAMGDLLGIAEVGIHDNFFELGGHSLLAIQAVTQLRKTFPVELPMRAFLFEAPTVAGISSIIQAQIDESQQVALSAEAQATVESLLNQIENMPPEERPPEAEVTEQITAKDEGSEHKTPKSVIPEEVSHEV
ncbi:MAG: KR domain-containing protein, partial [Cyanobacteria bacterium J06649_4]